MCQQAFVARNSARRVVDGHRIRSRGFQGILLAVINNRYIYIYIYICVCVCIVISRVLWG